jgi:iron complex transport system substrate-binding protein
MPHSWRWTRFRWRSAASGLNVEFVTSSHTPRRIACLQPSATVILAGIGEIERVIACTKYCADVVPEIAAQPRIILADSWAANAEQIMAARPDLVIAAVPYQEKAVVEILKAGVRFLGLAPKTLADIYTDIATIAGIVGAGERGEEAIANMRQRIEQVRACTAGLPRPRVFCEEWGKPLIASQAWVAELVEVAGGEFLGAPGRQISPEEVARMNPDVLIAAWCGAGDRVPLEKIVVDRNWQGTLAARASRIYCIRDEYLNTPAPTLLRGLDALAFAIHPERFGGTEGIRQITSVSPSTAANQSL